MTTRRSAAGLLVLLGALGCSSRTDELSTLTDAGARTVDTAPQSDPDAGFGFNDGGLADLGQPDGSGRERDSGLPDQVRIGGARPTSLMVPDSYSGTPTPLIILLHGYGASPSFIDMYFQLSDRMDRRGFFLVVPEGNRETLPGRRRFWDATWCCNFSGRPVDDVGYLSDLIDEAASLFSIDPDRVAVIGHSNGGFMAYRMACDASDKIRRIVSLAGATWSDPADCGSPRPVSVLQIHGTSDATILYEGASLGPVRYPSADESLRRWAARGGCDVDAPIEANVFDFDRGLGNPDTDLFEYTEGCTEGRYQLWRVNGGGHAPAMRAGGIDRILDFVLQTHTP